MKFIARIYEEKFNGSKTTTGKQLKQKTFNAEDWDEADIVAHQLWQEVEKKTGLPATMSLSVIK